MKYPSYGSMIYTFLFCQESSTMASRSYIGIENEQGYIQAVYCHWDGYLEHNGLILFKDYNSRGKISLLINQGALSSLGQTIAKSKFYVHEGEALDVIELAGREDFILDSFTDAGSAYLFTKEDKWIYWDRVDKPPIDLELAILRLEK